MNILLISVRSDIGGGPKHMMQLAQSQKIKSIFIAAPEVGEYSNELKLACCKFLPIPFRRFSLIVLIKLLYFCKNNKISIVHSHGRGAGIYSRVLNLFGYKVIHTFHGINIASGFIGYIKLLVDKLLVPFTSNFICVSESEKSLALKYKITIEQKTKVIVNGVKIITARPGKKKQSSTITLGILSRLSYEKGIDILLQYLTKFELDKKIDFKCLIGGDGELQESLHKTKYTNKITFLGNVEPKSFLTNIDIYISFSRWEGLPLAVLEAMSHAKSCLVSNVDGNRDLIKDGYNGFLFKLDDYNDFSKKLKLLIESKELRQIHGKNAKADIAAQYSIEKMIMETNLLYELVNKLH